MAVWTHACWRLPMRFRMCDNSGMEKLPEPIRELRPHATWKGVELLFDVGRAAIMAALIALRQWFIHHWDILTIVIAFVVPLALLVWRDISHRHRGSDSLPQANAVPPPAKPTLIRIDGPEFNGGLQSPSASIGIGGLDFPPKITRDFVITTSGNGRQEIDVGFPVDFLRLYRPDEVLHLTREFLPFKSIASPLTLSVQGDTVILNDYGVKVPVEFLAYSSVPVPNIQVTTEDKALAMAPQPLITYDGSGELMGESRAEVFEIYNEGPSTASCLSFGELKWTQRLWFKLCRETPQIASKNRANAYLEFGSPNRETLHQFLQRPELQKSMPTVTVTFQDSSGNQFCRVYTLHAEHARVIWNPGPVKRLELEDSRTD